MKKAAGKRKTTTATVEGDLEQYVEALEARQQFFGDTLNMSWRLALTVLIPIIGGVKLDQNFGTTPSLTLLGLMIAAIGACVAVWDTVKEVNMIQADSNKENKRK